MQLILLYSPSDDPALAVIVVLGGVAGAAVMVESVEGVAGFGVVRGAGLTAGDGAGAGATDGALPDAANARDTELIRRVTSTRGREFLILVVEIRKINIHDVSYTVTILCQKKACRKEEFEYTIYTFVL